MEQVNKCTGEIVDTRVCPIVETKLSTYNDKGEELLDSKPVTLPIGFTRPLPLGERIRKLVQDEVLRRELGERDVETFDEADDFDVEDDIPDRTTPFEENFDPMHTTAREQELRAGFVQELPGDRLLKAKDVLAKAKAAVDIAKANAKVIAKAKAVSDAETDKTEAKQ